MKHLLPVLLLLSAPFALAAEKAPRPSLVVTAPLVKGEVSPLQTYVGTLYYDKKSALASESEGSVSAIMFREGERVRKGDTLLTLDSSILKANTEAKRSALKALEADLTRQERDMERTKVLYERNSISRSNYDQVFYATQSLKAKVASIQSEVKAMDIQLEKSRIKAPFDAIITARNTEVGEWVGKGATVATLVATDSIEARLNVPARLIGTLRNGQHFSATIGTEEIDTTLKSIIPLADVSTRSFPLELNVPNKSGLIEGMRIDVKIPLLKQQEALLIPRDAVIKRFGQTSVFAAVDGKAVMIPVEVIGYQGNMAAISGQNLQEKMRIVTKGNERIFPNMPVMEKGNQ